MPDISKVILNGVTQMDVTQDTVAPGNLLLNETATMSNGTRTVGTVDLSTYAPLNSPDFTGTPTAPTAAAGTNTTQIATTAFVKTATDETYQKTVNPNLLDNWYFVGGGSQQGGGQFPINQRGATSGTTTNATYGLDRWIWSYGSSTGTWALSSSGLTLTPTDSIQFIQKLRSPEAIDGKMVTASVLFSDGTLCSGSIVKDNSSSSQYYWNSGNNVHIRSIYTDFRIIVYETKTIVAAKLELGSTQTLAHKEGSTWVLNEVPNYADEFNKCIDCQSDASDPYSHHNMLVADLTLHVDVTNGSDSNTGLDSSHALQTVAAALNKIPNDMAGRIARISLAAGTYPQISLANKHDMNLEILPETGVSASSILIGGYNCADTVSNSWISFVHVTFIGGAGAYGAVTGNFHRFGSCVFDGGLLSVSGHGYITGCTFRNLPNHDALTVSYGTVHVYTPVIENTCNKVGIKAASSGIVSVSSYVVSNNATIPYECSYSGRIFIGPRTYQEDHSRVQIFGGTQAIAQSTITDVTLTEAYNHFQTLELLFDQGNADTRMSIHLTPTSFVNDASYVIGRGSTIGTVRISNYAGSYSIIRFKATTLSNLRLINVFGQY